MRPWQKAAPLSKEKLFRKHGTAVKKLLLPLFLLLASALSFAGNTTITINPAAQPAGVTVTSFNVYRSTVAGAHVLGSPTASVPANGTSPVVYVEVGVPGQTTFFVFTAVCPTCTTTESVFSGEISGTTPANTVPNAPVLSGTWK